MSMVGIELVHKFQLKYQVTFIKVFIVDSNFVYEFSQNVGLLCKHLKNHTDNYEHETKDEENPDHGEIKVGGVVQSKFY